MTCDLERLEPFVLGELSATAAAQVAAHARSCTTCAEEIQWLRREQTALAARTRSLAVSVPAFESTLARAQQPQRVHPPQVARSWVAGLATAAALLVAVGSSIRLMPLPHSNVRMVDSTANSSEVASAEVSSSEDTGEAEAIANEEYRYDACLWASPGQPVPDACL